MKTRFIFIACIIGFCIIIKCVREISYYFYTQNIGNTVPLNVSVSENVEYTNGMYTLFLDVSNMKPDVATIPLSMLVEYCSLVQLEYNEEEFGIFFTTVTEKYIGVCCSQREAYQIIDQMLKRSRKREFYKLFDRSGKFLCNLEQTETVHVYSGRQITDDIIDDKNELIYLAASGNKILVYNTSGQFVKNIIAPYMLVKPKLFLYDNILTVLHITTFSNVGEKAMMLQFDVNTVELVNELMPPEHLILRRPTDGIIYSRRNTQGVIDCGLRYHHSRRSARDTLYRFDGLNNMILPVFTTTYSSARFPRYKPYSIRLNKDLILSAIWYEGLIATDLKSKTSSWVRFKNDYYGNMYLSDFLWQDSDDFRNGYYVRNITQKRLIYQINERLSEKGCTENDRMALKKMMSNLKKWNNNNNVIFLGKLKRETKFWYYENGTLPLDMYKNK